MSVWGKLASRYEGQKNVKHKILALGGMDSILIFEMDRIYRIFGIFFISGFRMKPGIYNSLRQKK